MFKKALQAVLAIFLLIFLAKPVLAQDNQVDLYLFYSTTCPHCEDEIEFLEAIQSEYPNLSIHSFEVGSNRDNLLLFRKIGEELNLDTGPVPMTFLGKDYFVGYRDDGSSGELLKGLIEKYSREEDPDVIGSIIRSNGDSVLIPTTISEPTSLIQDNPEEEILIEEQQTGIPDKINLPIVGSVKTKNLSLPTLTFVIALADGFNPCAMWVLLFLISLLLGMKEKWRMWLLGSVFIFTSGFIYFVFLVAWLKVAFFVGFVYWIRVVVGIFALAIGAYYLRDYYVNKGACKVTGGEKRKKVFDNLKQVAYKKNILLALLGIVFIAIAVNMVELVCSFGLPMAYTQVLALTSMPRWQYYLYLAFYILIFMIDDILVFVVAMKTLHAVGIDSRLARYSRLVSGIVILLIGLLMLFKPELLMFGG